jgi:hypothetical protein
LEPALSAVEGAARRKHSWDDAVLKRAAREPHRQWPKLDTTHYPIHSASRRMVHAGRVRYPELHPACGCTISKNAPTAWFALALAAVAKINP